MHEFLEKVVEQARLQMNLDTDRFGGNLNRGNIGTFLDTMVAYAEEGGLDEEECKVCIVLPHGVIVTDEYLQTERLKEANNSVQLEWLTGKDYTGLCAYLKIIGDEERAGKKIKSNEKEMIEERKKKAQLRQLGLLDEVEGGDVDNGDSGVQDLDVKLSKMSLGKLYLLVRISIELLSPPATHSYCLFCLFHLQQEARIRNPKLFSLSRLGPSTMGQNLRLPPSRRLSSSPPSLPSPPSLSPKKGARRSSGLPKVP